MTPIKAIIIDDEPKAIDVLKRYCEQTDFIDLLATFRDPVKALSFLQDEAVALLFLDINMPLLSGMELLNVLKVKPKIIFTTAYSEYALDSYDHDALDYLLKPIDFQRFLKAVAKAKQAMAPVKEFSQNNLGSDKTEKTIYIKSGPQLFKVNTDHILYIEKEGNYLTFHTKKKKILSRQNMKDVFAIVGTKDFVRIHKSYVVALKHIEIIESHQICVGSTKIPVGRNYREALMKRTNFNG